MAAPAASSSPPKSARASIRHHLRELQVAYESLQEQQAQVAAQAILSPTRRRATDPGSPALPPRCAVRSLPASPLPPSLPASAPGSPGFPPGPRPARSPTRTPLTADRLQQRGRHRSHSAAATPVTDAAQLHERLAAAAAAGAQPLSEGAEPLDSYHRYAAQLFERRFCPLRTGLQGPPGAAAAEEQQQTGAPPAVHPQQQQEQQERQQQQQAGAQPTEQQQAEAPPRDRPQQAGPPVQQPLLWRPLPAAVAPSPQQQAHLHTLLQPRAAPMTPADQRLVAAGAVPASASCSSGGSHHSYASEEGDVVQVASPERGLPAETGASGADAELVQPRPPQPAAAAEVAQRASFSRPASAQRGGGQAQQPAASPLPLLSAALQLLTSPAGQPCSPEGIGPLRLAFDRMGRASADAGTIPAVQLVLQPAGEPAEPAVAAEPAPAGMAAGVGSAAPCSSAACGAQQREELGAHAVVGSSNMEAPAAGLGASPLPLPASQQAAAADEPAEVAAAAAAAGEQPRSAAGRAQALQRLKQRRLLQRGDSAQAAPSVRSSCGEGLPQLPEQPAGEAAGGCGPEPGEQLPLPPPPQQQQQQEMVQVPARQQGQHWPSEQRESPAGGSPPAQQPEQREPVLQPPLRPQEEEEQQQQQPPLPPPQQQQQPQAEGPGGEEEGAAAERQPARPFLRRRSQMVPMQKLPDWKAVRPRTSSRWEGGASGASTLGGGASTPRASTPRASTPGAGTPGGSGAPAASRPRTPTAAHLAALCAVPPATAPPPPLQRQAQAERSRPATASRAGGRASSSKAAARPRPAAWQGSAAGGSSAPATYLLPPMLGPPAAGEDARAAAGRQADERQKPRQQRGSTREEAPGIVGGSKGGKRGVGGGGGSARTTPFAPRPNSGESRQPWDRGHGGSGQAQRQQRVRGTPIYDASTLLPLGVDGLLGGGVGGELLAGGDGSLPAMLVASSLYAGHHGAAPTARLGSRRLARSGGGAAAGMQLQLLPAGMAHAELAEAAAAEAGAVDGGPLDDLLSAVDRMLHQVERALD